MSETTTSRLRILWILPPIIVGILIFSLLQGSKQGPQESTLGEPVRNVRTMMVTTTDFTPVARGYGVVQPAQVWKSIAQVSGRVVDIHPRLDNGEIIQQGEMLLQIDPVDYELNLAQAESQLSELDVEQSNSVALLEIEQNNLALAEKESKRLQKLVAQGSVSKSDADTAERNMLNSRTQVQNLKNALALLPSKKKLQQAKIRQARRDLDNTVILAPFNMRINDVNAEEFQFVSTGQHLFSGDAIDRVEIVAQVAMSSMKNLFSGQTIISRDISEFSKNLSSLTGFKPEVELDIGNEEKARWDAEFVRFADSVDSETRTLGVVIAVDKPLQKVIPGIRPPLSKDMFVEVAIAGRLQPDRIVVPRSSIRNGKAYVLDADNRLQIRSVSREYDQQDETIITEGLSEGDQLILSDIIPAVAGMLLKPVDAEKTGE